MRWNWPVYGLLFSVSCVATPQSAHSDLGAATGQVLLAHLREARVDSVRVMFETPPTGELTNHEFEAGLRSTLASGGVLLTAAGYEHAPDLHGNLSAGAVLEGHIVAAGPALSFVGFLHFQTECMATERSIPIRARGGVQ